MPNGTATPSVAGDIDAVVDAETAKIDAVVAGADEEIDKLHAADRSKMANVIVGAFVVALGLLLIFVIASVWSKEGCKADIAQCGWSVAAEFMLKALTTVLLPVVTLVLGYYFGTAKK
jgi:hypothetical protein